MKQRIQAGAHIDAATPAEVRDAIASGFKSWQTEAVIGARFTRFSASVAVAAGAFSIGGEASTGDSLGPPPGFIWDVRRLRVSGMGGADVASVYINDASPSSLIAATTDNATQTGTGAIFLWDRQVVLQPGDNLRVVGTGLVATTGMVTLNGQVQELPISQAWRLIG